MYLVRNFYAFAGSWSPKAFCFGAVRVRPWSCTNSLLAQYLANCVCELGNLLNVQLWCTRGQKMD